MFITTEQTGSVAVVLLDDERRRNAITAPMVDQIVAAFDHIEADDSVTAAVITGAPPAFCSGADVGNLARLSTDASDEERASIRSIYEGFLRVRRSTLPTIAAVNGPAVGAGCNLALACDVRLAGESARFDPRFPSIGLHPGGGHTWMLERVVGPQTAAMMLLFGEALDAATAVDCGLAWSAHPDDELLRAATELASRTADIPKLLAERVKRTLQRAPWVDDFEAAIDAEVTDQTWSMAQGWFAEKTKR